MVRKNDKVHLMVHKNFFNQVFEPERMKLEKVKGCKFTQSKFTEFLAKNKVKFVMPKQNEKFMSKRKRKKR